MTPCPCRRCTTTGIYCADGKRGVFAIGGTICQLCRRGSFDHQSTPPCPQAAK